MEKRRKKVADVAIAGNGTTVTESPFESSIEEMPLLTRDMILSANDRLTEVVDVPEWGGRVRVRSLTGAERDRLEQSAVETRGKSRELNMKNLRAKLVALSVIDAKGTRVFQDHDVALLGEKSAAALQRVWDVASRLSGLTEQDAEELAKNSGSDQSGGLSSV